MPPKRRRRFQGLYYHSSPPKVLPMNGQIANGNGRRPRGPDDFSVKLSTIRIWMHEKDIGKLTRVLWAGQGNKLRQQASTNAKVKRFLAAVPYVMNSIKDVHQAVIDNNLENLQAHLEEPVPPALVTCRDANGLNLVHKAAGLGHATILEYLISTWPDGVHETDITGKTPLHWAASAKNNMRCYTLLTQAGCDEEAVDYKMKTPSFYRHKPHEIERAFLTYVPEAPRVSPDVATDWEALSDDGKKLDIKIPEMNGFGRHSNAESNENTSEAEMIEVASGHEDEDNAEDNPEPLVEEDQIAENPAEEEAENMKTEDEQETIEKSEEDEEENKEENEENNEEQSEETKDNQEEHELQVNHEDEEMPDKEEPQDEKQQTQTLTEATANLTKETTEDDKTEHNILESKEPETDKIIDETDLSNETTNKSVENETAKVEQDIKDKQEKNEEVSEENSIEQASEKDNKETSEEKIEEDKNEDALKDKETSDTPNVKLTEENLLDDDDKTNIAKKTEENMEETSLQKDQANNTLGNEEQTNTVKEAKEYNEENDLKDDQDKYNDDQENGLNQNENEKENTENEVEDDSKTLGETLADIKDEVKENIKYLANQVKNVFSDKDEEDKDEQATDKSTDLATEEKEGLHDKEESKNEMKQAEQAEVIENDKGDKEEKKENESLLATDKHGEGEAINGFKESDNNFDSEETNAFKNGVQITEKANENLTDPDNEIIKQEIEKNTKNIEEQATTSNASPEDAEIKNETQTSSDIPATSNQINNSLNDTFPFNKQIAHPAAPKTPNKESPKKEYEKTEEDENNNKNSKLNNDLPTSTTTNEQTNPAETVTDEQFKELNESLKEYEKSDEKLLEEEKHKDIGDKLKEIKDTLKESVNEMADKVKNVISAKSDSEKLDTESNDVVMHTESPQLLKSVKASTKTDESSDDTADEDEESKSEAENEENNSETEENNAADDEEVIENNTEPDAEPEPEPDTEPEPENELEPKSLTDEPENEQQNNALETELNNDEDTKPNEEERDAEGSITSSLAIEGFVQGDAEDNTVQSQTAAYVDDDEEKRLQNIIASGDMEQLAQIVLNGDGKKLLNVEATEPEIQAFLKNVPNYMSKIRRVHEAARSGSLLNLQQALDRRKFAIAKDEISPNGATPLHVAVLCGNSDIVRYLSARFPETTTITDNDERTALHYAAVINDNGHFYNVLLQLGANPKAIDNMGHTPEDYLSKEGLTDTLNYSELLKRFGAEDLEEQLLSDQGRIENQSIQENPLFKTEQGKYLADNLADPLIKALTQVAQKRPHDPLQYLTNYLQSYVASRNTNGRTIAQVAVHSGSSQTNSTILASSKQRTPATVQMQRQTAHGHINNADNIEEENFPQIDGFDEDDGNDSDAAVSKKLEERDEHGQSMLHFACARSHRKGGLIHLIQDAKADITYRDELYRTARDVALQANHVGNAKEIDRYVMSLAIVGDIKPFEQFASSGYDHIIDVIDDNETPIIDVIEARELYELAEYLKTIRPLEELREELHQMIRDNNVGRVKEIADGPSGKWLIIAKNYYGRTALHIAILKESVEIVEHFVNICPEALKVGDNLERTPLHYAMGTNIIESISRILIQNGAKRTHKDLKGRQPSYYFMNKADILRLQEEEDESR